MAPEIDELTGSVRRLLDQEWPLERAGAATQSVTERARIAAALSALGLPLMGGPDAGGFQGAMTVVRELGTGHCAAPVPDAVVLNAVLLREGIESPVWLQKIQSGEVLATLAPAFWSGRPDLGRVRWTEDGLQGELQLLDALGCDHLVVLAERAGASPALVFASLQADGVQLTPQRAQHEAAMCRIGLNGTQGELLPVSEAIAQDIGTLWRLMLATRATGALGRALDAVVAHVQQRKQFGTAIGAFQAIQHKLANVRIALDGALLTQDVAAQAFDGALPDWRFNAESAIAAADPSLRHAMLEVHHAFGAIGYAEEHEAPRHFRRVHGDLARADGGLARQRLAERAAAMPQAELPEPHLGEPAERFRAEVRAWLAVNWAVEHKAAEATFPVSHRGFDKAFSRRLGQAGWIALTWPRAQGGQERSRLEQLALIQELSRAGAPVGAHTAAAALIAPALLLHGSPQQQADILPRIASGELTICLGYSEPEAGSDLASLRTRAVRDGDHYVITGQKMWGTLTDQSDAVWLAARTDPDAKKHAGISVFLVPMDTPGISLRPSLAMYGKTFCTQFYDEVRVPASALVGGLNNGWHVITGALADERIVMGANVTQVATVLSDLVKLLRDCGRLDALAQDRLGGLIAEVGIARALLLRSVRLTEQGPGGHVEAAMTKAYTGELMERFGEAAIDLAGPLALLSDGEPGNLLHGELDRLLRYAPMQVIGGGANEIQRTLIAQRGLALPR